MARYWVHSDPTAADSRADDGQRECARAERCSDPRIVTATGKPRRLPALTYQAFCVQDRTAVSKALNDLPLLWVRVHQRLDKTFAVAGHGPVVAMSKTAPVPIHLGADELCRLVLATLVSWEERVRTVARLRPLDTQTSRWRRDGAVLTQAYTILSAHLDALLALPAEMMARGDGFEDLSGADAGLELLDLVHRCRRLLTDNRQAARHMSGVYCDCGFAELYELLDDDGQHAGASCRACRAEYDRDEYADLTKVRAEPVKTYRRRSLVSTGTGEAASGRA